MFRVSTWEDLNPVASFPQKLPEPLDYLPNSWKLTGGFWKTTFCLRKPPIHFHDCWKRVTKKVSLPWAIKKWHPPNQLLRRLLMLWRRMVSGYRRCMHGPRGRRRRRSRPRRLAMSKMVGLAAANICLCSVGNGPGCGEYTQVAF